MAKIKWSDKSKVVILKEALRKICRGTEGTLVNKIAREALEKIGESAPAYCFEFEQELTEEMKGEEDDNP
jgi:hypothetical protein